MQLACHNYRPGGVRSYPLIGQARLQQHCIDIMVHWFLHMRRVAILAVGADRR